MTTEDWISGLPQAVGLRVRAARLDRGWTLDELAERSGVSRRMIVNVESGSSNASLATLLRLAGALRVSLADLVTDAPADSRLVVTESAARRPLWHGTAGGHATLVSSTETPDALELWEWVLGPGDEYRSEAHRPGTRELLHVHTGRLRLMLGDDERDLRPGDGVAFVADRPHRYANPGARPVRFTMTVFEPAPPIRP